MPETRDPQGRHVVSYWIVEHPSITRVDYLGATRPHYEVFGSWPQVVAWLEGPGAELNGVTIRHHWRRGYGSTHHLTTRAGSQIAIYNEVDGFGRGHSHVLAGVKDGRSQWIVRNVSAKGVIPAVRAAEAQGWTHVTASMEAF